MKSWSWSWTRCLAGLGAVALAASASGVVAAGPARALSFTNTTSTVTRAYVANAASQSVSVIDTANNTVIDTIGLANFPVSIAVAPGGGYVYVVGYDSSFNGSVSVIDTANDTIINTIDVGQIPAGVAFTPDGTEALVANELSGTVSVIDTATEAVTDTVDVGGEPTLVAVTPDGTQAYVGNFAGGVSVIDTANDSVTNVTGDSDATTGVAISPDGSHAYVANLSGTVSVVDTATNDVIDTINLGATSSPRGIVVTPDGAHAYVADTGPGNGTGALWVIDTAHNDVIDSIHVSGELDDVALTPDGAAAYATNTGAPGVAGPGSVAVIDTANNTIIDTIEVGDIPASVAVANVPVASLTAQPATALKGTEGGSAASGTVATFSDSDPFAEASEFSATVDWGDGTAATAGTVTATGPGGTGPFEVSGSHAYAEEGDYSLTVTVDDLDNPANTAMATAAADIADAPLMSSGVVENVTNPVNTTVATFSDADPGGTLSDYSATINWGDGTPLTAGIITAAGSGSGFTVSGTHTYAATAGSSFTVKVHICDIGGACTDATSTLAFEELTGRAYGLAGSATLAGIPLVNITPRPDTGAVSVTGSTTVAPPCVASLSGLISAHNLCASVTTTASPGASNAAASVNATTIGIVGIPVISLGAVQSTSTTTCKGSSGTTTIASLKVGSTVVIAQPTTIAPNTTVNLGVVKLVLNEQVPVGGTDTGLTVNAVHVTVNALGLAKVDVVVASSESDIGGC